MRAERAVLAGLGGGCQLPVGAYARWTDERLRYAAVVVAPDRPVLIRSSMTGRDAMRNELGAGGRRLLGRGRRAA